LIGKFLKILIFITDMNSQKWEIYHRCGLWYQTWLLPFNTT